MDTLTLVIDALSWIGVTLLVFFLWRIARFYERSSGERAYSWLFLPPLLLLPLGAAWYLAVDPAFVHAPEGDVLLSIGGILLLWASVALQQVMMGER